MARQIWACTWCLGEYDLRLDSGLYETEAEAVACEARHEERHREEQKQARKRRAEAIAEGRRRAASDRALLAETAAATATPVGEAVLPADWLTMPVEELEAALARNVAEVEQRKGADHT